ncbi:ribosomal protein L1/ribosomal biogenesis protein [Zychaea mexicana]|uniref:ribosomal protein L1/ribosomal biogenesis protein n=1 Tax=Zychaea mexicana TaxID=64656 RepID=UPI0022FF4608|nr:ribosomal protein L1/ribosomal biogenesis protein [Zychaea mexicana]KAI9485108.1 ribosomal protein L1/ribosomal biogenesis protein [Zychaea mexicana]
MLQIDDSKARKAFKALYKHEQQKKDDNVVEPVWLTIATQKNIDLVKSTPLSIPLRHATQTPDTRRCLFTKDPQKTYKDLLIAKKIKGVHKVIGISKLKKEYASPEKKRELFSEYGAFLTDKRIAHLLPRILGKEFFKKRKEPMPVDLTKEDLQKEILRAVRSTYMHFNYGNYYAIKIATTGQSDLQAFENCIEALPHILKGVYGGSKNIRSLHIKTSESTSLPVYEGGQKNEEEEEQIEDEEEEWEDY